MQISMSITCASSILSSSLCFIIILLISSCSTIDAHNITKILAAKPEFSTFNHYLTITHLAQEINRRQTITVCAVNNAGMAELLSKQLSLFTIKNVLSLHILLDYFGAKKLHQITNGTALSATMFQATGSAPGSSGFVNITDLKGGKVGFGTEDNDEENQVDAYFVKSVKEIPYNISVIQISKILPSSVAEAPTPGPSEVNLTALMSKQGCKVFSDLLISSGALPTFEANVNGGLTIFCPIDEPMKLFLPKYNNLTTDDEKSSLLSYHGIPVYESMDMLKSSNGVMNTLATDGGKTYQFIVQNDGEIVTLKTKTVTAKITGKLFDELPLAIYTIDKVLLPKELFKTSLSPTPAPAPAPDHHQKKKAAAAPDSSPDNGENASSAPEPFSPDEQPADDDVADDDNNGSFFRSNGGGNSNAFLITLLLLYYFWV